MTSTHTGKTSSRLAFIPARGGSKRIQRKNIREFWGHPLIAYTIAAARNAGVFERIIVSTEDDEIAQVARWYGAEVMPRAGELANDTATVSDVAIGLLIQLHEQGYEPDMLCSLMPVCPLRTSQDIRQHLHSFETHARSFQISVVSYRGLYPQWAHTVDQDGVGTPIFALDPRLPSQQLGASVCPTGAIWCARTAALVAQRSFYGAPFHMEIIDDNRGIDIDNREDWELADLLVHGLMARDKTSPLEIIDQPSYITRSGT